MKRALETICCIFLALLPVLAHSQQLSSYQDDLQVAEAAAPGTEARVEAVKKLLNIVHHPSRFALYAYPDVVDQTLFKAAIDAWLQARVDQQVGNTSVTSASTNVVSRPSSPELGGLAMEIGGITKTVSGSTATFRGNADGILHSLAGQPLMCIGCMGATGLKALNFAVSFDLNRQGTQLVSTSGPASSNQSQTPSSLLLPKSKRVFSSFTATYDLYNPKDTRSKQFQDAWAKWFNDHQKELQAAAGDLLNAISGFLDPIVNDPAYADLRGKFTPLLQDAKDNSELEAVFARYLSELSELAHKDVPTFNQQLLQVITAYAKYAQRYNDLISELNGKPQLSFQYTFDRPVSLLETHNLRFVYSFNPYHGPGLLSLNLAGTFYGGSIPAGAKYGRVRDVQFAAQFDRPLGNAITHPAVLTLAGYYQYQLDPTVIKFDSSNLVPGTGIILPGTAQALLGTKGSLGIVQGKVTIKLGNSGAQIPLAVTWASRTDLLNATDVAGHIGITYNLDALLGR